MQHLAALLLFYTQAYIAWFALLLGDENALTMAALVVAALFWGVFMPIIATWAIRLSWREQRSWEKERPVLPKAQVRR